MVPGNEFREALKRHGLTQVEFARMIDVDDRTVRRWANGSFPPPGAVRVIIELLDQRLALKQLLGEERDALKRRLEREGKNNV